VITTAGAGRRGAAVLGSPIAHSLSPVLHLAAYGALGLTDWTYRAVECDEATLLEVLRGLEAEGLAGASLTMPLKRSVLPMLARTDRVAAEVRAANTVVFGGVVGEWWGANTDVPGMVAVLRDHGQQQPLELTVLGGGATAASAVAAAAALGIQRVTLVVRRPEAAAEVVDVGARLMVPVEVLPWASAAEALDARVVVSTVPAGAADELASRLPARRGLLFDVVYSPWPTPLAQAWGAAGGDVAGGLELLVAQAAEQVRLMTGQEPPVEAMRVAGEAALAAR
jgi:shikimate dehydrogenase